MKRSVPINRLDNLAAHFKFFADTCSLMHSRSEPFFYEELAPYLCQHHTKLIIPKKVIEEVHKHLKNSKLRPIAATANKILKEYQKQGILDIKGEKSDPFADNLFITLFHKFRQKYNLLLITQDRDLIDDILAIRQTKSVTSRKKIKVLRLTNHGFAFADEEHHESRVKYHPNPEEKIKKSHSIPPLPKPSPVFLAIHKIISGEDVKIPVQSIPTAGMSVSRLSTGVHITLGKEIARGGEGTVFELPDNTLVAKVYDKNHLTKFRYEKLKKMVKHPICEDGICWPIDLINNSKGEWCGYVMPRATGIPIQHQIFIKPNFQRMLPLWSRINLVRFTMGVLEKIEILNHHNVIIGDINPLNILMDEERSFFVDTDSYQIEGYPCPVGTANYTAPEIQKKEFSSFLRTQENENFSIATLVFMLLVPGKPPYSHQGGGDPVQNIIKRDFSYGLGGESNGKAPDGPWRFIWSNLPYKIKEALYGVFKEGAYVSCAEWVVLLKKYLSGMRHDPPFLVSTIYPRHFKPITRYTRENFDIDDE